MLRRQVVIGAVGLVLAAAAVRADVPKQVKLFDTDYNVTVTPRAGTFKNGVKITAQTPTGSDHPEFPDVATVQKANLAFVEGADASADRLFVAAPIGGDNDGPTGDQFYLLRGADPTGVFNPTVSEATSFWGNVDRNKGGRPNTITFLSDVDTGPKKDRNIVITTFTGDDHLRFYDLDTLKGDYLSDAVFSIKVPRIATAAGEDVAVGVPNSGFLVGALGPNNTLIVIARNEDDSGIQVGVMDPTKDQFANALTDLVAATGAKIDPANQIPHALARVSADEYWLLTSELDPGGNNDNSGQQNLYRLKITLPADLGAAQPDSIKAEVLGVENLTEKNLHQSEGGLHGMAVGRELAAGKRVVYFADWIGNLITLSPVVTPPAAGN